MAQPYLSNTGTSFGSQSGDPWGLTPQNSQGVLSFLEALKKLLGLQPFSFQAKTPEETQANSLQLPQTNAPSSMQDLERFYGMGTPANLPGVQPGSGVDLAINKRGAKEDALAQVMQAMEQQPQVQPQINTEGYTQPIQSNQIRLGEPTQKKNVWELLFGIKQGGGWQNLLNVLGSPAMQGLIGAGTGVASASAGPGGLAQYGQWLQGQGMQNQRQAQEYQFRQKLAEIQAALEAPKLELQRGKLTETQERTGLMKQGQQNSLDAAKQRQQAQAYAQWLDLIKFSNPQMYGLPASPEMKDVVEQHKQRMGQFGLSDDPFTKAAQSALEAIKLYPNFEPQIRAQFKADTGRDLPQ